MNIYGETDYSGVVIKSAGELDMGGNKIINLKDPVERTDAATSGWVDTFTSHLNNSKVNWSGGTMTGDLSMGGHTLTNVGNPKSDGDAVNKQYVDDLVQHEHDTKPFNLGRYIVFPHEDGTKTYFSVRAKKNVDLDSGLQAEVKNGNEYNADEQTAITTDLALVPNPGKDLSKMEIGTNISIGLLRFTMESWTLLFSGKYAGPSRNPAIEAIICWISYELHVRPLVKITQHAEEKLRFHANNQIHDVNLDMTQLQHIAVIHNANDDSLTFWVNGKLEYTVKNITYDTQNQPLIFQFAGGECGIMSLYNRTLNKHEIIQHFVDNHVMNFTDDELLI